LKESDGKIYLKIEMFVEIRGRSFLSFSFRLIFELFSIAVDQKRDFQDI
jgi:hypothetical protein